MKQQDAEVTTLSSDLEVLCEVLPMQSGERLLELGCGAARTILELAELHPGLEIIATEVDEKQHRKNLEHSDVPNVTFVLGGAEAIAQPDVSVDYVLVLKSLHHVPGEFLERSLSEVQRVLKPGGLAYISEPIAQGPFNDILRLFHDEAEVRGKAFSAIRGAVAVGTFELVEQIFFNERRIYEGFGDYERDVLLVTHSHFEIDAALHDKVRAAFAAQANSRGAVEFHAPQRVDLLRRPRRASM